QDRAGHLGPEAIRRDPVAHGAGRVPAAPAATLAVRPIVRASTEESPRDAAVSEGFVDAAGTRHDRAKGHPRIVSLVRSITELLCGLGLASALVGRTGFCIHPRELVRGIPKVGGTKNVDLARLRSLSPTHVILNVDENRKEDASALAAFVPCIIVTHPLAPL